MQTHSKKKRILNHLGRVGIAAGSFLLFSCPAVAIDPVDAAGQVIGSEGGRVAAKEALNSALKIARSKPAMSTATGIVCLACVPVAGVAAAPSMCVACGILIAKTLG